MRLHAPAHAGQTITLPHARDPKGVTVQFDPDGYAEVSGLARVQGIPGYHIVGGAEEPVASPHVLARGPLREVVCQGPRDVAGEQISCPDGATVARFDSEARAAVPETCRLDEVPGYYFLSAPAPSADVPGGVGNVLEGQIGPDGERSGDLATGGFSCPTCGKVCKTAAALKAHVKSCKDDEAADAPVLTPDVTQPPSAPEASTPPSAPPANSGDTGDEAARKAAAIAAAVAATG